jgi:single-strand DNA-binding protein
VKLRDEEIPLLTFDWNEEKVEPEKTKKQFMNTIQNTVNLIGRTGVTPTVKTFENGVKLAKFSLATNETVIEPNGKSIKTQWHHVIAWGIKAELVEKFVKKGQLVAVDGRLINRVFTDPSGSSKKVTEIQVNDILLINPQKTE